MLDASTLSRLTQQLKRDPSYAHGADRAALGDVEVSGFRRAVIAVAGRATAQATERALRHAVLGGGLESLLVATTKILTPEGGGGGDG